MKENQRDASERVWEKESSTFAPPFPPSLTFNARHPFLPLPLPFSFLSPLPGLLHAWRNALPLDPSFPRVLPILSFSSLLQETTVLPLLPLLLHPNLLALLSLHRYLQRLQQQPELTEESLP